MMNETKKADQVNQKLDKLLAKARPSNAFKVYLKNRLMAEFEQQFNKKQVTKDRFNLGRLNLGQLKAYFLNPAMVMVGFLTVLLLLGVLTFSKQGQIALTGRQVQEVDSQLNSLNQDLQEMDQLLKEAEEIDFLL